MVTGASTANLAIILIDARHGILHPDEAPLLHRRRCWASRASSIAVNKMDLVDFAQEVFDRIVGGVHSTSRPAWASPTSSSSRSAPSTATTWSPAARRCPGTTASRCSSTWRRSTSAATATSSTSGCRCSTCCARATHFRGYAGQIASGVLSRATRSWCCRPGGRQPRQVHLELRQGATAELDYAFAPMSVTVTLEDEIDVSRGDMLVHPRNLPASSSRPSRPCWSGWPTTPMDAGPARTSSSTPPGASRRPSSTIEYRVDVNTLSRAPAQALRPQRDRPRRVPDHPAALPRRLHEEPAHRQLHPDRPAHATPPWRRAWSSTGCPRASCARPSTGWPRRSPRTSAREVGRVAAGAPRAAPRPAGGDHLVHRPVGVGQVVDRPGARAAPPRRAGATPTCSTATTCASG